MKSAEGRGRTLDEAVDAALIELQESRRNVDVKILSETIEETVVEVTVVDQGAPAIGAGVTPANGKAETARTLVEGLLKHMGVRATVQVRAGSDPITLDVSGRDLGALIGWRGETLRALQSVRARVVWRNQPGLRVPVTSVLRLSGQTFLFVISRNAGTPPVARQKPVKLGPVDGDYVQVTEGLKPDDEYVVAGLQKLRDGAAVTLQK